mgnify:CR=1 FL=1
MCDSVDSFLTAGNIQGHSKKLNSVVFVKEFYDKQFTHRYQRIELLRIALIHTGIKGVEVHH